MTVALPGFSESRAWEENTAGGFLMVLTRAEVDYYAPIKDRVLQVRVSFRSWANSLSSVRATAWTLKKMSQGRSRQGALADNLVGERDAFWLGELFNASQEDQQEAALGCICGYAYFLHQDHSLGKQEEQTLRHELAKNYLFSKMVQSFQRVARDSEAFWEYWGRYLDEYTDGCFTEERKTLMRTPYDGHDLRMVAHRSSPVKACMAAFALATGHKQKLAQYERGIDELVVGLQIRDDLADLQEDTAKGEYTYAISRLVEGQGSVGELLDESSSWLLKAAGTLGLQDDSALGLYIEYLVAENAALKEAAGAVSSVVTGELRERFKLEY